MASGTVGYSLSLPTTCLFRFTFGRAWPSPPSFNWQIGKLAKTVVPTAASKVHHFKEFSTETWRYREPCQPSSTAPYMYDQKLVVASSFDGKLWKTRPQQLRHLQPSASSTALHAANKINKNKKKKKNTRPSKPTPLPPPPPAD